MISFPHIARRVFSFSGDRYHDNAARTGHAIRFELEFVEEQAKRLITGFDQEPAQLFATTFGTFPREYSLVVDALIGISGEKFSFVD